MAGRRKCPSKACFCAVLTAWIVAAVIVFLATSLVYLKPLFRSLRFTFVPCVIENSFYLKQFICQCGYGCRSVYPCVLLHVSFNASDGVMWTVSLYNDDKQQQSVVSLDHDAQEWCSLKVCQAEALENHHYVENFFHKYEQRGTPVECAYDPWDIQAGAVLTVTPLTMAIFHALFWPFFGILIGVVLCVIFCRRCQQDDAKSPPIDGGFEAAMQLTKLDTMGKSQSNASSTSQSGPSDSGPSRPWGRFLKHNSTSIDSNTTTHKAGVQSKIRLKKK